MSEKVERVDLVAARGESLGPDGRDRVASLELWRDPRTGSVSALAVLERADGSTYETTWTTSGGNRLPAWAWAWVKKLGLR